VQDKQASSRPDDLIDQDFVHLARVALSGGAVDVPVVLRRFARRYRDSRPAVASALIDLLRESPMRGAAGRAAAMAQPVDHESRLPLIREGDRGASAHPILSKTVRKKIEQLIQEYKDPAPLIKVGLAPTRTALFTGPPGVGKTLSAQWLAQQLNLPLLILDLSSVMSSFLGRTGANVRRVLDYAKVTPSVLLIDELDAVAKRRDDATELGELKRLVTVLLQEIDNWPEGSLLLAASNHSELLDPAIWRRFEMTVEFPLPSGEEIRLSLHQYLGEQDIDDGVIGILSQLYAGLSFSHIEREVMQARRRSAIQHDSVEDVLIDRSRENMATLPPAQRIGLAVRLVVELGMSQRRVHELTGVSRDTLRKHLQDRKTIR
jgi:SpoVK/Ycf46/Vps4 family AAA+-type ATPase